MTEKDLKQKILELIVAIVPKEKHNQIQTSDYKITIESIDNEENLSSKIVSTKNINITISNPMLINVKELDSEMKLFVEKHNQEIRKQRQINRTQSPTEQKQPLLLINDFKIQANKQFASNQTNKTQTSTDKQPETQPKVPTKATTAEDKHSTSFSSKSYKSKPPATPQQEAPDNKKTTNRKPTLENKKSIAITVLTAQRERLQRILNGTNLSIWERITNWFASFFPENDKLLKDKIEALDGLIKITEDEQKLTGFNEMACTIENPNTTEYNNNLLPGYYNTLKQKRAGFISNPESYEAVVETFSALKPK